MDKKTVSMFLQEDVAEYLESQSEFSDFFANEYKLIEILLRQDLHEFM